jgi:protein disulfide-isomerase A6
MNKVKLIEFYSNNCPNCKSFVKEYNELAKQLSGIIKIAAVNCDQNKKICDDYGVTSFPTLKVIPPGGFGVQDYSGERTSKAVYSWVVKYMTHFVEKVNAETHDVFLNAQAGKFKALLFTDKPKTPLIWKGVRSPPFLLNNTNEEKRCV